MKYYRKDGQLYVENGPAKIRVALACHKPSPLSPGRTVKVLEVLQVLSVNPSNPIKPGNYICLSFPNEKLNSDYFDWREGDWQETQVPMKISDRKAEQFAERNN